MNAHGSSLLKPLLFDTSLMNLIWDRSNDTSNFKSGVSCRISDVVDVNLRLIFFMPDGQVVNCTRTLVRTTYQNERLWELFG